ncbi:MAG: hypothetical protein AB7U59_08240 [Desulfovibrionaceae bacterium]
MVARFLRRTGALAGVLLACWCCFAPATAWAAKVDTRSFNAYFASQSGKIYDHLLKVTDYYASLAKEGNADRIKDVLALRASLSACWELFLNAGDMVYVYDVLDPACADTVNKVGGLLQNGLTVIAGKLDKELQWMRLVEKNVADLPVSVELTQAGKDIEAVAAYFRKAATLFAPTAPGETRQPVRK